MADARKRKTIGTRFRFLTRALGLLGVGAAATGAVLFASAFPQSETWTVDTLRSATHGDAGGYAKNASIILHVGLFAIALFLVVEALSGLFLAATRRTAAGSAATIGAVAAIALLAFVTLFSFPHSTRRDLTRDQQFTLPASVADELKRLRSDDPTTIVVLQKHRTFGLATELRDSYASESEAKVAEKVKDLVDQFREFGPRFNVVVLDTEEFGYESKLDGVTKDAPELKAAIDAAPENSILFHANGRVQRLGFNEFLQLDRTASKEANGGRGNLGLLPPGVESFARRHRRWGPGDSGQPPPPRPQKTHAPPAPPCSSPPGAPSLPPAASSPCKNADPRSPSASFTASLAPKGWTTSPMPGSKRRSWSTGST